MVSIGSVSIPRSRTVDYWPLKGTEVGMLGGLGFKGAQTAADGSDHKGTVGWADRVSLGHTHRRGEEDVQRAT